MRLTFRRYDLDRGAKRAKPRRRRPREAAEAERSGARGEVFAVERSGVEGN